MAILGNEEMVKLCLQVNTQRFFVYLSLSISTLAEQSIHYLFKDSFAKGQETFGNKEVFGHLGCLDEELLLEKILQHS